MDNYLKKFDEWAEVQKEVNNREYGEIEIYPAGGIFWINQGINIGSEQDGKGHRFTRPALIITRFDDRLVLIAPVSSKIRRHRYRFKIMVEGELHMVLLDQIRVIDCKRIENFIDQIPDTTLRQIRSALANLIDVSFHR